MQLDNGQHVIISSGHSTEAYACTLANAKKIVAAHEHNLGHDVLALDKMTREKPARLISIGQLCRALKELESAEVGKPLPILRKRLYGRAPEGAADTRPEVVAEKSQQDELILWLHRNKINLDNPDVEQFNKLDPFHSLACLQPMLGGEKPLVCAEEDTIVTLREWRQLSNGTPADNAKESAVVARYLQFVNENLVHRDQRFELARLAADYS